MGGQSLTDLQRSLFNGVRELPGQNGEPVEIACDLISPQPPLDPLGRLNIYRTGHWLRIFGSLQEDFPRVRELLGEELFEAACEGFIREMPSRFESIAELSGDLSTYFGHSKWDILHPGIQELARFEWLLVKMDYVAPPEPLDWQEITRTPLDQLGSFRVRLNPTATFRRLPARRVIFSSLAGASFIELADEEEDVLRYMEKTRTIDEVAEQAATTELSPERLMPLFSEWVSQGLIVKG